MESSALVRYVPQASSKKRVFHGSGSSSSSVDPDVVEIPPPAHWSSKSRSRSQSNKRKEVTHYEIINIDMDNEQGSILLIDDEVDSRYKGKQSTNTFRATPIAVDGQSSNSTAVPGAPKTIGAGFSDSDFVYGDNYMDLLQDGSIFDDEDGFLQAHFDSIDIPTGIEASIPWFSDLVQNKKQVATTNSLNHSSYLGQLDTSGIGSSHSGERHGTSSDSINWQTNVVTEQPYVMEISSFPLRQKSYLNKNKSDATTSSNNLVLEMGTGDSGFPSRVPLSSPAYSRSKRKSNKSGGVGHHLSHDNLTSVKATHPWLSYSIMSYYGNSKFNHTSAEINEVEPQGMDSFSFPESSFAGESMIFEESSDAFHLLPEQKLDLSASGDQFKRSTAPIGSTSNANEQNEENIIRTFQLFKNFDTVEDHSDHYYSKQGSPVNQQSKKWAKRIQEEWKILQENLPDTIFVRVYESRMDLLRAVIVGAEGTPYHDGLFFFDIFFPSGYPSVPPLVYYHSGGLRINPNLYECGKVCLSLLNTWSGSGNEKWIPNVSTMLQVLVSIQALILNEKPYFNEPGFSGSAGSKTGEEHSQKYSEGTFILSLKTMVYSIRRPPKHFEEFVIGHFLQHAQDILMMCKAYIEGVQVGCLAKGGIQDVDAGTKRCSQVFKSQVACHITMLVQAFAQIGAKDCDKFLALAEK